MTASSRGRTLGSRRLLRWAPCHRLGGTFGSELQPSLRPFNPSDGRYQFRAEGLRGVEARFLLRMVYLAGEAGSQKIYYTLTPQRGGEQYQIRAYLIPAGEGALRPN